MGSFRGLAALKSPVDRYIFCMQYADADLERAGARRQDAVECSVDEGCLKTGARLLAGREYLAAFRHWAFSWAAFPGTTARTALSWALLMGLCLGPIGSFFARVARRRRRTARAGGVQA
jgi:hypothetical protein